MKAIGVVVEYNPFHNGHLYHLNYIKSKYPDYVVIAIMSGNFMQRGQVSLISKWDKTKLALHYGIDIVLDYPFVFASESADYFANNAVKILNSFGIEKLVFGSETNDSKLFYDLAEIQLYNEDYNAYVKEFLANGYNYPTACSKALSAISSKTINLPNDILGLSYVKSIVANNFAIEIDVVKRISDFHSQTISEITSASAVRKAVIENKPYEIAVPQATFELLNEAYIYNNDQFFDLLKYKIIASTTAELCLIHLVDEGIEHRVKTVINESNSFDELVQKISTKRYTYSRVSRMLMNILINYSKKEREAINSDEYLRVLGFTSKGQKYLKHLNRLAVNYDVTIKTIDNTASTVEYRASAILQLVNSSYIENAKIIKK